ncbi:MAG TPA: endo alpha-1,4 polygalactosaminidase [Fodinibius sp.]|nr:endo alpha-1,4 polygalactosaminidase [Fodinibius sp.]
MIYIYLYLLLTAFIISIGDCAGPGPDITKEDTLLEPFAVSYEKIADLAGAANEYKLLIVEPEHYSKAEVDSLNTASNTLLAYVTLGEVDRSRWYYPLLEARGFLGVNENWDSPYLNLADSVTRSIMLDRVIPNIMIKGYDGLILDTVDDVAPYTDRAWLQPHMVDIIAEIDREYPDAFILQNAGLFLLDRVHNYIDALMMEDVATSYNFEDQTYHLKPQEDYDNKVDVIEKHASAFNKPLLIVDYSVTDSLSERVIERLDSLSHPYFIGSIWLNDITETISSHPSR